MNNLSYALLLDDVNGYRKAFVQLAKELTHRIILKGSLLIKLNTEDISTFKEAYDYNVNYMVYSLPLTDSYSYLFVSSRKVQAITNEQRDFLYGIEGLTERLEVYKKLEWIEKLTVGSVVYVTIATTPYPARGIVQWIGILTNEYGKKFGIELLESKEEGTSDGMHKGQRYFFCKNNSAVFVAVDKLTDFNTASSARPHAAKGTAVTVDNPPLSSGGDKIKLGSLVTFLDINNHVEKGVVRWVGRNKSDDTEIVGIETENQIKNLIPHNISEFQDYFKTSNHLHSKIFLPVTFVRKHTQPVNHKGAPYSLYEECSDSDEDEFIDAGADLPLLCSMTETQDTNPHGFQVESQIVWNGHCGIIKWIGYLPDCNVQMAGLEMFEQYAVEEAEDGYWDDQCIYECAPLSGTFVALNEIQLANRSKQRMLQDDVLLTSDHVNTTVDHALSKLPNSTPTLSPSPSSPVQLSDQNPYKFKKESKIQLGSPVEYGVIKWIGMFSPENKWLYAGVEMENAVDGCTDGMYKSIQYFESQPGKGKFVKVLELQPDKRYSSGTTGVIPMPSFEVGSMVQFGDPAEYGKVTWIGCPSEIGEECARVLAEDGRRSGLIPISALQFDSRHADSPVKFTAHLQEDEPAHLQDAEAKYPTAIHQVSTTSGSQTVDGESKMDQPVTILPVVDQIHQNMSKMEEKFEGQMKRFIQNSEEKNQRMEDNVDNAFRKALDVQKSNDHIQNQLALTQQQLLDVQKNNEHLQSQMLTILDKLSHTQQQLLDMQKSNEQLQEANTHLQDQLLLTKQQLCDVQKNDDLSQANLQNQLSLTQQQLLGVQSMMTCSRLWVVSHDQFTIGREIGRGAWASVHETTFRGAKVAAKRLHDRITSPDTIELFHREMEMALHCQHQNIVTFLGVTLENHPVILMELMDISLRSAYERGNVKYQQVLKIFYDIASALHFLHTRPDPVIHRDVSSANVLLKACGNEKWLAKLGDLGTAKLQQYCTTPGPGALAYAAPEVADPKRHSTKMDVYSFGILVVEVLTKTLPFQNLNTLTVQVQQQFPQYHQLVTNCTNQQSSGRPTMYDVIGQLNKISTTIA